MHPGGAGQRSGGELSAEDPDPAQRKALIGGNGQIQSRLQLQILQIDVGGVEPVEQHQAVSPGIHSAGSEGRDRRVVGGQLHRQRHVNDDLDCLDRGQVFHFDVGGGDGDVGGDGVEIQLQGIGPGVDEGFGVVLPGARTGRVEAGDHRDLQLVLGFLHQLDPAGQGARLRGSGVLLEQRG